METSPYYVVSRFVQHTRWDPAHPLPGNGFFALGVVYGLIVPLSSLSEVISAVVGPAPSGLYARFAHLGPIVSVSLSLLAAYAALARPRPWQWYFLIVMTGVIPALLVASIVWIAVLLRSMDRVPLTVLGAAFYAAEVLMCPLYLARRRPRFHLAAWEAVL
jgi:hypothetical protein